jgi:hypothetical protein
VPHEDPPRPGMRSRGRAMGRRARAMAVAAWLASGMVVVAWGLTPPLLAEGLRRYSGRVTDVDLGRGLLMVEELGRRGVPVCHEVRVDADTLLVSASRLRPRDMRGSSAFAEVPVSLADVLRGDFVVVEAVELDGQSVARRVTIVETRPGP